MGLIDPLVPVMFIAALKLITPEKAKKNSLGVDMGVYLVCDNSI